MITGIGLVCVNVLDVDQARDFYVEPSASKSMWTWSKTASTGSWSMPRSNRKFR